MKTLPLLPLAAAALFAACTGSMLMSAHTAGQRVVGTAAVASPRIVDLATVTVRPDSADMAAWMAGRASEIVDPGSSPGQALPAVVVHPDPADRPRIVDLATVTVRPDPADMAAWMAGRAPEIVDLPAVVVRPEAEDAPLVAPVIATVLAR